MLPTKMKLALMSSPISWGGGEQFLWSLCNGLVSRGHQVLWICDESSSLHDKVQKSSFPCCPLSSRAPRPKSLLRLRRACTSFGVQVLHANDSHAFNWGSLAMLGKLGIKRVRVKHTAFPIRSSVPYNWMLDKLVCVSNAVREVCLAGGVAKQKTSVIHGGLEPPKLERWLERFWACDILGIHHKTPLYCAVGSLIACKGYHRLIEAAHHLRWHMPEFCIVVCGEGKARPELEQLIRKYSLEKHVRLLGFQNEPERWICAADAFVHPSQSEGLSLVVIQAQMIGTPVIATEVGGLKEVLRSPDDGQSLGWICEGNDPATLARLMTDAIQNTEHRFVTVRSAREYAIQRFHVRLMIDKFEDLFLELTGKSRSRDLHEPINLNSRKLAG